MSSDIQHLQKILILTESTLLDHAGWTITSKMPTVYVHYFGTGSAKKLLEAKGIIQRNSMSVNVLKAKPCPNCSESNKPDSKFCSTCKFVLSYDAFIDTLEEEKARAAKEAEESKKRLEESEAKHEILQANTASVLHALMAAEMGIKPPPVKIIAWNVNEGSEGLLKAAAIARAENEAREKEHQQKHHKQ